MGVIVSVINQKGGVGKSTTAHNLGAALHVIKGQRVLFVDLDPQSNLSIALTVTGNQVSALDLLCGRIDAQEAIVKCPLGDVIPSNIQLSLAESIIKDTGREYKLKEALDPIKDNYDYIIIDTPPALGVLTINALTASDFVVIPALADVFSVYGVNQLANTINTVHKYCNPNVEVAGIVLTKYNPRTVLSRDMRKILEEVSGNVDSTLFDTAIRESVSIREAQCQGMDIYSYAPKSNVASDYTSLLDEFLKRTTYGHDEWKREVKQNKASFLQARGNQPKQERKE